ncbi:hypothetical protein [Streptomyces abyssomicinicus]|uniref:hypothetical protein n=1 Tax=Streptomyces abyssomicinicus TaxID=574929 RepID=UPI001250348A|nr:hypothetical protein [Streptomyces abyssomicinicus]
MSHIPTPDDVTPERHTPDGGEDVRPPTSRFRFLHGRFMKCPSPHGVVVHDDFGARGIAACVTALRKALPSN